MSLNGIAHLTTKRERQNAKLALAAQNRAADGNARATLDESQLPTLYAEGDNDTADVVNNPNPGGLVYGRPWIATIPNFTFYEAINTANAMQTTQYVNGIKIYAYSSNFNEPSRPPARVVVDDVEVVSRSQRGHTLVVLDNEAVVQSITTFDTYGSNANTDALASALNSVASGNIVALVVWDASACNGNLRASLTNNYSDTNNNTWAAGRYSHIFIGIRV